MPHPFPSLTDTPDKLKNKEKEGVTMTYHELINRAKKAQGVSKILFTPHWGGATVPNLLEPLRY